MVLELILKYNLGYSAHICITINSRLTKSQILGFCCNLIVLKVMYILLNSGTAALLKFSSAFFIMITGRHKIFKLHLKFINHIKVAWNDKESTFKYTSLNPPHKIEIIFLSQNEKTATVVYKH